MTTWFRTYYEDEDLWLYFEADDEGWAARQVPARRSASGTPVVALHLEEKSPLELLVSSAGGLFAADR